MQDALPPRPGPVEMARMMRVVDPYLRFARPAFTGWENVPSRGPLLFVGNHTLYGFVDVPLIFGALWHEKGLVLRGLADHRHFAIPRWREFMEACGVVDGTRENCAKLMEAGDAILVFPGGAREVAKRKGERHKLLWGERVGFTKMALAHDATIVPFAVVGVEDLWDIVVDGDELLATPLGRALTRAGLKEDFLPPLAFGMGPTPLPRLERLYIHFAPPLHPADYATLPEEKRAWELREATRRAIEGSFPALEAARLADPDRQLMRRHLGVLARRVARRIAP